MIRNEWLLAVLAGAVLAMPYVVYARRSRHPRRLFAIGLPVAAAVYLIFAGSAGMVRDLLVESIGVVLFAAIAWAGLRFSAWLLALGWVAHVGWDLLLHPIAGPSYAPWWYPVTCIGFDLVVAVAILTPPASRGAGSSSRIRTR